MILLGKNQQKNESRNDSKHIYFRLRAPEDSLHALRRAAGETGLPCGTASLVLALPRGRRSARSLEGSSISVTWFCPRRKVGWRRAWSHGVWDVSPRSRQQRSVTQGAGAACPSAGPAGGGLTLADRPPAERRGKPSIRLPCNLMGREITAQRLGTAHVEATHSPSREGCRERLRSYSGNA